MKGLVVTAIIGLVFFGGAYAYSTMQLLKKKEADEIAKAEEEAENPGDLGAPEPVQSGDSIPNRLTSEKKTEQMPVPFAPKSLSERAILDLAESVKAKEIQLRAREEELNKREAKMQFILTDIQREKREFESVVREAQTRVTEGQRILQLIETKKQKIENDLKQIQSLQNVETSKNNLGQELGEAETAKLIETLDPDQLAETIEGYANDGQLERVGFLLSKFDKKNAAKAIAAIEDASLRQQVLNATTEAFTKQATLPKTGKKKY